MCSTFKMLLAACVLQRADRGEERLQRLVRYTKADLLENAPVAEANVGRRALPVETLAAAAVEVSDTTAANLLLKRIGGPPALTRWLRSMGDAHTRLDRMELELNSSIPRAALRKRPKRCIATSAAHLAATVDHRHDAATRRFSKSLDRRRQNRDGRPAQCVRCFFNAQRCCRRLDSRPQADYRSGLRARRGIDCGKARRRNRASRYVPSQPGLGHAAGKHQQFGSSRVG